MGFSDRTTEAQDFENRLINELRGMGFAVAKNGAEYTHTPFVSLLRQSLDLSSIAIRCQPDIVACIGNVPRSFFVDAKEGVSIEKLPYEHYMRLRAIGQTIVVVFGRLAWQWCFIEEMGLIDGDTTVSRFPVDRQFPVEDGWIVPRRDNRVGDGSLVVKRASFTPYREVMPETLSPWLAFKTCILRRLQTEPIYTDAYAA